MLEGLHLTVGDETGESVMSGYTLEAGGSNCQYGEVELHDEMLLEKPVSDEL